MTRHINPGAGNVQAESRHIHAHPNYNGGDDCNVCKSWHKMRKHEHNWRYYLMDEWSTDPEVDDTPEPVEEEPKADWELMAIQNEARSRRRPA